MHQYLFNFIDRPLLLFFPIYSLGIYSGWNFFYIPYLIYFVFILAIVTFFIIIYKNKYKFFFIVTLCFLLGFSIVQKQTQPPEDKYHVLNYIESKNLKTSYVVVGGYVISSSGPITNGYRLDLELNEIIFPGEEQIENKVWGKIRVKVPEYVHIKSGDYIRFPIILKKVTGFKNPNGFNLNKHWGANGFWVQGYLKSPTLITDFPEAGKNSLVSSLREDSYKFLKRETYEPITGLLAAQLLGIRASVDEKSEETFRYLGLTHILSVSGLHMGLCYLICFFIFNIILNKITYLKLRIRISLLTAFLALLPTIFYAYLVGADSPVIRSALMLVLVVGALFVVRKADSLNIVLAAAWLIILIEPYRLLTISYQLSFVATIYLVLAFKNRREKKNNIYWDSLKVALIGTFSTAPIVAYYFSYVPVVGVLANLVFSSVLSFVVLPLGLLAVAFETLCPFLATVFIKIPAHGSMLLMPILDKLADFVGPGIFLPAPSLAFMFFYYLAFTLFFILKKDFKSRTLNSIILLILAFCSNSIYYEIKDPKSNILRFTVLDIGQGSSIHINLPDRKQMLIDGGGSINFDPGDFIISNYLLRKNIKKIDIMALTHTDTDHIKGLLSISEKFKIKEIWGANWPKDVSIYYENYLEIAKKNNVKQNILQDLQGKINFNGATIEILWPLEDYTGSEKINYETLNNNGLVYKITYQGYSFLVTGDIGLKTEKFLIELYGNYLASTVLLAPHHGSKKSMSNEFLHTVNPDWVVFSAGLDNNYGMPDPDVLKRSEMAANIWRTDLDGAAVFEIKNNNFKVKKSN